MQLHITPRQFPPWISRSTSALRSPPHHQQHQHGDQGSSPGLRLDDGMRQDFQRGHDPPGSGSSSRAHRGHHWAAVPDGVAPAATGQGAEEQERVADGAKLRAMARALGLTNVGGRRRTSKTRRSDLLPALAMTHCQPGRPAGAVPPARAEAAASIVRWSLRCAVLEHRPPWTWRRLRRQLGAC